MAIVFGKKDGEFFAAIKDESGIRDRQIITDDLNRILATMDGQIIEHGDKRLVVVVMDKPAPEKPVQRGTRYEFGAVGPSGGFKRFEKLGELISEEEFLKKIKEIQENDTYAEAKAFYIEEFKKHEQHTVFYYSCASKKVIRRPNG